MTRPFERRRRRYHAGSVRCRLTIPATHPYLLPTALTLLAALATAPTATAQHILEVDLSAGRTIIADQWRSMGSVNLAVDHERGILYVNDAEEPEGIMAFSLAKGERGMVGGDVKRTGHYVMFALRFGTAGAKPTTRRYRDGP